jgi:multiple sugar transport system ATP-binding protein
MARLELEGVGKAFGRVQALRDLSLDLRDGEFFCVVGPTNAGKSTLLQTIAGLHQADHGSIRLDGRDITRLQPRERGTSLLFQNIALFPTLTGFDNIAFPLRTAGKAAAEVDRRVREVAALLKVTQVLDRLPRTFSGGEQQRVAIGRAIALRSDLLMLDEPLTNLDARIRIALRIEFKRIHAETGQTILYVTHDQVEALSLSDRIAVLHEGQIQQVGTPDEVYHRPANRLVAQLIGSLPMNLLPARLVEEGGALRLEGDGFALDAAALAALPGHRALPRQVEFAVRPERVTVALAPSSRTPFAGEVEWVENLGAKAILVARLGANALKVTVPADDPAARAGRLWFGFALDPHHLLEPASGRFFRYDEG